MASYLEPSPKFHFSFYGFLKDIYNDLEKNILLKNVKNNKEEIEKYILNNYK